LTLSVAMMVECESPAHTQPLVWLPDDSHGDTSGGAQDQLAKETSFYQISQEEQPVTMETRHWLVAVMSRSVCFTGVSNCIWAVEQHLCTYTISSTKILWV